MVHLDKQQPPHLQAMPEFWFLMRAGGNNPVLFLGEVLESGHLSGVDEVLWRAMETKLIPHSPFPISFPATELVGDGKHCKIQFIHPGSWLCVMERLASENAPRDAVPKIYCLNLVWYNVQVVYLQTFHGFCLQLILVTPACPRNHNPAANVKRSHQHVVFIK